jgi:hypothetical protein
MKKHQTQLFILFYLLLYQHGFSQNVGVGTVTPNYRLDIQSDPASTSVINVNSKINYAGSLDLRAFEGYSAPSSGFGIGGRFTGGYKGIDAICQGGAYSGIPLYGIYSSATGTAGTRVGVYGTASGASTNYGLWGSVNGGANHYGVYGQNANLAGYAGYFDGRGLFLHELRTNDNLLVDDDIGVGTITPSTKLQIVGGVDAGFASNGFIQTGLTSGWNLVIDDNEILARNNGLENDLFIQRDGGDVLFCALELGSVGVGLTAGTSIPSGYMFAVDGKIISEELRIQNSNNWPDYVFNDQYRLMPLDELKQTIAVNKHLPNIPSAATVEEDGILIGDMQKRMMEKIEELTLYILELNETNKQQQAEINQLKAIVNREP